MEDLFTIVPLVLGFSLVKFITSVYKKGDIMGSCGSCSGGNCGSSGGSDYSDADGEHVPYDKKKVKKLSKEDEQIMYW